MSYLLSQDGNQIGTHWSVYWAAEEMSLFCVVHDISERARLDALKQEFLSMVSQDLHEPLATIADIFEQLAGGLYGQLPELAGDKVAMACRNIKRLLRLVNGLLDLERLEAGQLRLDCRKLDLAPLFAQCLQEAEVLAQKNGVQLVDDTQALAVTADGDRLMQVIANLLSNAIKFSPAGGTVKLATRLSDSQVEIAVIDQGRGVPAEHRLTIFERFGQVSAADGKRARGTGLGLPICKQLIELHGGSIGVESEPDKGSTFYVRLPRQKTTSLIAVDQSVGEAPPPVEPGEEPARLAKRAPGIMPLSLPMLHKGLVLVALPLLFEIVFIGSLAVLLAQMDRTKEYERHLHAVSHSTADIVSSLINIGYAVSGTRDGGAWREFNRSAENMAVAVAKTKRLCAGDASLRQEIDSIDAYADAVLSYTNAARLRMQGKAPTYDNLKSAWHDREILEQSADNLCQFLNRFVGHIAAAQSTNPEVVAKIRQGQGLTLAAGLVINLSLSLLLALLFSKTVTDRLAVLKLNADRLGAGNQLLPRLSGLDEVAELDSFFHKMAGILQESRRKQRAVFDNAQDVICSLDEKAVIVQMNTASRRYWGIHPEDMLGSSIYKNVCRANEQEYERLLARAKNLPSLNFENVTAAIDGRAVFVAWSVRWSPEKQLYFCVIHDITKQKELERLKRDFLSMVSHDLRSPLSAIMGVAELLAAGALGTLTRPAVQQVEVIVKKVEQVLALINDLLDIEKLEAGLMKLNRSEVQMKDVLARCWNRKPLTKKLLFRSTARW